MKPYLEHLAPQDGASWSLLNRRLDAEIPFQWHHHPEMELTLTLNSRGQRFIGNHLDTYDHGDLVLIGPNLPHTWASREKIDPTAPHIALVFWLRLEWLEALAAEARELVPVLGLLHRAACGLAFDPELGKALAAQMEEIHSLPPLERLVGLLEVLGRLAEVRDARPLSTIAVTTEGDGRERIDRVLAHMHDNYRRPLALEELAGIAALSVSGLHRLFRRHTGATVSDYLIRLRIGEACSLLAATDQPVARVAEDVGYGALANFNRQFKNLRGMTPRAYRAQFRG